MEAICLHEGHRIRSSSFKVYPYHEALGTPLYGKDRPVWKMPESFIETVEPPVWTFLESKKLWEIISEQMSQHFCSVTLEKPVVKLSPLPSFLRQAGLTAEQVEKWKSAAQRSFHELMSQYGAFKCPMNHPAWAEAEKDIRSIVREDAVLLLDASSEGLTVVGRVEDNKRIEARVKEVAARAMTKIQRKMEEVIETMDIPPALLYILEQEGLKNVAQSLWSDMKLSYDHSSKQLTLRGNASDVYPAKLWIVEKKTYLISKQMDVSPVLLDFLKMVDSEEVSEELFTSKGTCATYTIDNDNNRMLLSGRSDSVLADAEHKIRATFNHQTLDVEDPEVLHLPEWMSLKQKLVEDNNSSKTTVSIQDQGRDKVIVVGFLEPVNKVSRALKKFIVDHARVEETIQLQFCTLQFIVKKRKQECASITDSCGVQIQIDEERPSISLTGARCRVLDARTLLQNMIDALSTDQLVLDKPGAKKYFQLQGSLLLSPIMTEQNCVVVFGREDNGRCLLKVATPSGLEVHVREANICLLDVDAVVNAANERLQHIGGLALMLLQAAGPELQKISDDHVSTNGPLSTGEAVATDACRLPCRYVIHAVGPRFSEHRREDAVVLLQRAVTRSLTEAERLRCCSVAVPAISSGTYGFPLDLCAHAIAQAVWEHCHSAGAPGSLREIQLVGNNPQTSGALALAARKLFDNPGQAAG